MLLSIPQCTGQPRDKELHGSHVNSAEFKKPWFIVNLVSMFMRFSSFFPHQEVFIKFINRL